MSAVAAAVGDRRRVLFVDDEPMVLSGLRDLLRPQRRHWDMHFASDGQEALDRIKEHPFDVIVSDMRMPRMDGAALLQCVRDQSPRTVRIVLSGHAEMESAVRSVPIAHQFLSKPCEPDELRSVIERACALQTLLDDEGLRRHVGSIQSLPSSPRTYHALVKALSDPNVTVAAVAAIVERDPAIAARVLQVVNSAFFGLSRRLTRVLDAVSYLGLNMIKSLTLTVEVFRMMRGGEAAQGFDSETMQTRSMTTASIAKRLLKDPREANDAFTAGILHDIGELVRATREPKIWSMIHQQAYAASIDPWQVERRLGRFTHAEEGAYLLGIWGLPYGIVEAVAYHHDANRLRTDRFGVAEALHVAAALSNEMKGLPGVVDTAWLQRAGLAEQLDAWREIAKVEAAKGVA